MKKRYDIVFVVLVYRNTQDLEEFFIHLACKNAKTIVVESFYNNSCTQDFKAIAKKYNADFVPVPNKGYGAGNNRGCEYAMEHYEFDYLVISNADIIIKRLDLKVLRQYNNSIIAPKIINLKGKNQNPSSPFNPTRLSGRFALWIYNGNHTRLIWIYFALSRLKKILFYCTSWINRSIFSAHGAFVIIPKQVLMSLYPLYNEEMFLFNEEEHLGKLALSRGIKTYYEPKVEIVHKEDGSMKIASVNEFESLKQSYNVYFNCWIKNR
ncbi:Glycosyltransferase, GT2 family [Bacteroides faecichinchillae]|uniref:Glycosyltransferase, GT2 family n=1 Tax=Bacteroides faecichinchillae TaxID=871325 RepID=A0A1M5DSJ3_9BACE|nr:hypothetical protein [Bacteroides faecichinchillae]THG64031.1 hypothetical protein E5981_13305 [Bacteroides faecichinchillae]SHF69905.1 Glycosyltransferase, GT2 family [Bacteroides faecichinchillae]